MSTKYLKRFFKPESIAVFGASERDNSMGGVVLLNLLEGGYAGRLMAVNSQGYEQVHGVKCYKAVQDLPEMPDLAIICSPPATVPDIIRKLGANMVKAAMILSGGLSRPDSATDRSLREEVREAAHPYGIRILGPDCMGMLVPGHNMNASYSHVNIGKGKVAYIGQSGLLGTAMIDWANGQEIGFSHFLTLGEGVDVDLPSVIDYLAQDPYTQAILLQMDRIVGRARDFISAVRAASRNKLVLVLKSGIIGDYELKQPLAPGVSDENQVYDAALRRAGAVRVETSDQLYNALETLSRMKPLRGERLAIVCNGMGPAALAADRLMRRQGQLAELTEETLAALSEVLPEHWDRCNPIDLHADARPERFAEAVRLLSKDKNVDAVLVIHAPTRLAPAVETADAVITVARNTPRNILTSWMGRATAIEARNHFNAAGVTTFITPEEAVDAFMYMVDYHRNQAVMRQTPPPYQDNHDDNLHQARELIANAAEQQRDFLTHSEASQLLTLFDIPLVNNGYASTVDEVAEVAEQLGGSVAVKALHRHNVYPFSYDDRGNLRWQDLAYDLYSGSEVQHAVRQLDARVAERMADASHRMGYFVQEMKRGFQSMQMSVGITRDPAFGPLILFGSGGFTVDVLADRHFMLPPMNLALAKELVKRSRISRIIAENSYQPERDIEQIAELLVKLSEMVVDLPELKGLEINPLLLNKSGILALDIAVSIGSPAQPAISPYPEHLSEQIRLRRSGRPAVVRAIRGEDEPNHLEFYNQLSPESIRLRYFYSRGVPTHMELANWTQIDYDREMAFIVSAPRQDRDGEETLGVVRAVTDADNIRSEFSVVIRDDLQGEGLGVVLMQKIIDYCKARGTLQIYGSTLPSNKGMQGLAKKLGFKNSYNMEEDVVDMKMMLNEPSEDWQIYRLQH
ncbi:bifunctional acetate--CoA ligase family protein/GNAT family N-acetyltransferase [Marinobacterium arenosum]|uniref:bifunctional acetate--CoA ligase family protein/GNAT family N-acetyltransferase n=1 Tax=Marinobacterium arenosum TaxID=2862496 RepID=UPI001C978650|nr:bifunctional acetate--CoA ligase family protein/GNAT family N-acetyltransferase [Marinobacterium arenosum]MBY4675802.1 bifunctional acetate--CoA ligase family protein/GNAT family N-acetyltransferase [Marinobacterium arenosum]